jgi:hypothetical protein
MQNSPALLIRVFARDTAIYIDNKMYYPTIVMETYYSPPPVPGAPWVSRDYYTKDIGLVKQEKIIPVIPVVAMTSSILVDYHINK